MASSLLDLESRGFLSLRILLSFLKIFLVASEEDDGGMKNADSICYVLFIYL